jgi:hypothetical protein
VFTAAIASVKARLNATLSMALWSAIACLAGLVAAGFFIGAVFIWVSSKYGSVTACVIFGAVFAVMALIALTVGFILKRRAKRITSEQMMLMAADLASIGAAFGQTLKGSQGKYYILGAIAAGWLISKTMKRR